MAVETFVNCKHMWHVVNNDNICQLGCVVSNYWHFYKNENSKDY